jgi:topoisomerase-4 subunit A
MDGDSGISYAKRFNVTGVTRDKEYDLTKGSEKSKVQYLSVNPNGEAEVVKINLSPNCSARIKEFDFYFETLDIKGRGSMGNQVTKYPVRTVKFKEKGTATLAGRKLWFDNVYGRLNGDEKGVLLGRFEAEDKILVIYKDGSYELTDLELTQRFEPEKILLIEKFNPEKIITAVYADMEKKQYYVKRFKIETTSLHNKFFFIKEDKNIVLETITLANDPVLYFEKGRGAQVQKIKYKIGKNIEVTGWKSVGTRFEDYSKSVKMNWVETGDNKQQSLFE